MHRRTLRAPELWAPALSPVERARKSDRSSTKISSFIRAGRFAIAASCRPSASSWIFQDHRQTVREAIYHATRRPHRGCATAPAARRRAQAAGPHRTGRGGADQSEAIGGGILESAVRSRLVRRAAAKVRTQSYLSAIKARLDAMRVLDVTDDRWRRTDIGFHMRLPRQAGNPLAMRIMGILREAFRLYRLKRFMPNARSRKEIWHTADIYERWCAGAKRPVPPSSRTWLRRAQARRKLDGLAEDRDG